MKKIAYALMFLFVFCFFNFHSNAQSPCSAVSVEVIESSSRSGQFKNWGIRVFITQPYHDDITVEGTIEGGFAELWTLTIPAGNTSAQTSDNYYQTDPVTTAVATITNVSPCPAFEYMLSEEESKEVIQSQVFQTYVQARNDFLNIINNRVNQGVPLDTIRAAALEGALSNNYEAFYLKLFSNIQDGETFFNSFLLSRNSLLQAYPFMELYSDDLSCTTCSPQLSTHINYFFDNYETFHSYRYLGEIVEEVQVPCGSYWNQVKLLACGTTCSFVSAGAGVAFCGWMCWCTFCSRNSAVGTVICAN